MRQFENKIVCNDPAIVIINPLHVGIFEIEV
jgi:hypothetical protein